MAKLQRKLVLTCAVLVHCMAVTTWAGSLKVEINRENTPAGWYAIEGHDIWAQGGQDVSFTFNGTELGDVTIGIKNNTTLTGIGLAVEHNWEGGYEPAGDLTDVAQDALIIVCDPDGGCTGEQAADIGLSFSGLLPYTLYQLTTYHTYPAPVSYGGDPEDVTVSVGGFVQGTVTPGKPDPVNVGTDMAYIVSTFMTDASGAYSNIAITAPADIDGGHKKMNGWTCGFELMVAPAQSRASKPDPAHGSDNACPGVILSWEPGQYADTHDVYFGTSFDDVNDATTATAGIYQGNQEANEFDTTPLSLQLGETYYWRIDVVNDACDPYLWPGSVWSFTTNDGKAFDPNPSDGYARLFPGEALNWSPGCQATSHDVYVGTDSTAVNAATPGVHPGVEYSNVSSPTYTPSLDPFKTYYWRVDEVNGGTYKGDIWSFKSGLGGLIMYYKFDGTQGNDLPPAVTDDSGNSITFTKYTSGGGSVKYGESNPMIVDSTASADFDPCAGLFRLDTGEHDMLRLDGKEYTIEMWVRPEVLTQEHDDIMLIGKRGGYSWEVTIEDPEPGSNRSYNCMHGGKGLYMPDNTAMEGEWAHVAMVFDRYTGDSNNLRLYLNGTVKDEERYEYQNPPDSNMATIGMEETDGPGYTGFMNGLIDEIRIHDIALAPGEFLLRPGPEYAGYPSPEDGQWDVDPNLVLGWDAGSEATSHDVYLGTSHDDVLNATTDTAGIYLGNVTVNQYPESGLLELEKGRIYYWRVDEVDGGVYKGLVWSFETVTSIFDPNLRAWYKLDEESGYTARDSSGRHFDAPVDTGDPDWDPDDGRFGGSLGFDDDTDVECPRDVLETIDDKISVSVWLKDAWRGQGATNWVFSTYGEHNGCILQAAVVEGRTRNVIWRAGDDSMDVLEWNLSNASTLEDWHQWVFVKDEAADTMSIYFDTILVKSKDTEEDDVNDTLVNIKRRASRLGAAEDGVNDFEGRMDDFRLYDKALSDTEIEELFRGDDLELAWAPEPYDGQAEVPRDANLAWRAGKYAVEHDVYLSSDFNDVNDATTASALVYKGRQDACEYDPAANLLLDTTYYWRIDEVNDPCLWKGNVWKFTVANYVIIDDFEQYDTDTNRIYYTWIDYIGGSTIDLGTEPFNPVRRGDRSMLFVYDNTIDWGGGYYSEVELPFSPAKDFTDGGVVKVLTLYFYGDPANDADDTEELYVGLGGSYDEVRYSDDHGNDNNDIKLQEWTEWNIPIPEFSDVDANLVTSLFIGFGAGGSGTPGGDGIVYFDDIRLYPPRCVPEYGPALDFSGNCIVDWPDVAMIGDEWLRTDGQLTTSAPIVGPVGWWKLDEGGGAMAWDDSGNFHDGTIEGSYAWITGRIGPYALEFTGEGGRILVPDHVQLRPAAQVSALAWAYFSVGQDSGARIVVKGADNVETYALETNGDEATFHVRDTSGNRFDVSSNIWPDEWTHLAGTFHGDSNTVILYLNGREADLRDDANFVSQGGTTLSQDTNDLAVGNRSDATNREFIGSVDDIRVYHYALTDEEVAHIATEGTGYSALESQVNIYDQEPAGQKAINIRDLAVLLDAWLEQKLWP